MREGPQALSGERDQDEPSTGELRHEQERRERDERRRIEESNEPAEAKQHERRSEKASYLKEKLAEREEAEED